ncbi:jg22283 [Pararge aegeria aegeria]|uniref:Jg22283 protein n=1 Tax=Pararge aegeria aegeria TaxID=348720 RepID=A0A8S4S9Z3_9NEOP|nr:jg22283 [Pararge aegeria aegeria]
MAAVKVGKTQRSERQVVIVQDICLVKVYLQNSQPASGRQGAVTSPKLLRDDLRLQLDDRPVRRAAGDRPNKLPAAPSKVEKIEAMDTTRSSVHSCCPCDTAKSKKSDSSNKTPPKAGGVKCCKPSDKLPTRTTSKDFINSSGDKK